MIQLLQPLLSSSANWWPLSIEEAVEKILTKMRENREKRAALLKALLKLPSIHGLQENFLKKKIQPTCTEELRVSGVDGGMLELSLHGIDVIFLRTIAVRFHYLRGKLEEAEYIPCSLPLPKIILITEPIDHMELQLLAGMERQLSEVETAIGAIEGTEILMLDGSIVPQYVERFPRKSRLFQKYRELIDAYISLYRKCLEEGTILAGVVKDSRGARFAEILKRNLPEGWEAEALEHSRDTVLLDRILEPGERTACFTYAEEPESYVLKDLQGWGTKVSVMYLKLATFDRPTRVEFIWDEEPQAVAERLSSLLYSICSPHPAFGIPSVLVEADRLARLGEEELEPLAGRIADVAGEEAMKLRRERRPF